MINIHTVLYCFFKKQLEKKTNKPKHWILPVVAPQLSSPCQQGLFSKGHGESLASGLASSLPPLA